MKKSSKKQIFIGLALAGLLVSEASATPFDLIKKIDRDGDGIISVGAEMAALAALRAGFSGNQMFQYEKAIAVADFKGIKVDLLDDKEHIRAKTKACDVDKRFFLQDTFSGVSLLQQGLAKSSDTGAAFSLTRDNLTGSAAWNAKGALLWLPPGLKRCVPNDEAGKSADGGVTGHAYAPYIAFEGEGTSAAPSTSSLIFGVHGEWIVFGGKAFDLQQFSVNPYYRTDFQGVAQITGVEASWKPRKIDAHLNGNRKNPEKVNWWWTFSAHADFQKVAAAGTSGLTANSRYGWVGVKIGGQIEAGKGTAEGFYLHSEYQVFRDLVGGTSANLWSAGVGKYLNEDKRSSIELLLKNGLDYNTLTNTNTVKLNVKFAL